MYINTINGDLHYSIWTTVLHEIDLNADHMMYFNLLGGEPYSP